MRWVVIGLVGIVASFSGCDKRRDGAAGSASSRPTLTAGPAAAGDAATIVTTSVASFTKDDLLDECDDFTFTLAPGVDAGAADIENGFEGFVRGKKGMSRLTRRCAEQFATNAVLATCTMDAEKGVTKGDPAPGVTVGIKGRYYNLDTLTKSDVYRKNCIDIRGAWDTVDQDSDAYRTAVRARAVREAEKAQKTLGQ
ncbi:MAG: hypothetical protein ACLP1X_31745 [Polyangiaceae bacterium]